MAAIERLNVEGQTVEGILIRQGDKGIFLLENVTEEDTSLDSIVTSHPIEDGSETSDHIILKNKKYKVDVIVSDASFINTTQDVQVKLPNLSPLRTIINQFGFIEQFGDNPRDSNGNSLRPKPQVTTGTERFAADAARRELEEIRDNKEVLTFRRSIGDVSNVVVKSVKSKRNKDNSNRVYSFSLMLEQLQIRNRAAVVNFVERKPDVEDKSASKSEYGKQGTGSVNASVIVETVKRVAGVQ
jgi:hypothetical protein